MRDLFGEIEQMLRKIVREEVIDATKHLENRSESVIENGNESLMTIKETADCLGISTMTLHRLKKRKTIGYFQVGTRILFSRERHLEPYLKSNEKNLKT